MWGPAAAYMALIFAVSSISHLPELPRGVSDKTAHLLEYAGLSLLTLRAFAGGAWEGVRMRAVIGSLLFAIAYGVSDEVHQLFVPGRQFDVKDMAADAIGAGVAAAALWTWGIIRRSLGSHSRRG
jgi:VanZ family protein